MRAVLQRVRSASVSVSGQVVARIGLGFCLFVGVEPGDDARDAHAFASKVSALRVFSDDDGKMNLALGDVGGEALVVSQFTLFGDVRRGRRPSFSAAAPPEVAAPLIDEIVRELRESGVPTSTGVFGAHMEVDLVNDGPVTLWLTVREGMVS